MGTQFTSRLSAGDARKVRSRVRSAWRSVAAPRSGGRAKIIDALSTADRRKLGDTTMAEILQVAEEHSFSEDFSESRVFVDVLDWLKRLQTNAKYNGFQGMIKEYDLDNVPTPSSELGRQLDALAVKAQGSQPDPFRVSCTTAARSVLAKAMTQVVAATRQETDAKRFGRKLAELDLKKVVSQYIESFVGHEVEKLIRRADPKSRDPAISASREILREAAERLAHRAVKRVEEGGLLTKSERVRDIVFEELRELTAQVARKGSEP